MRTLNKTLIAATIATLSMGSANAFFGGSDNNQSGYGTGTADGIFNGRGRGTSKGTADAEGNFSMSINASGKGSTTMEANLDAAENVHMNGTTDIRTENQPSQQYYGIAPPVATVCK